MHTYIYTYIYTHTYTHIYIHIKDKHGSNTSWTYRCKYREIYPLKPDPDKSMIHSQTIPWPLPVKTFG